MNNSPGNAPTILKPNYTRLSAFLENYPQIYDDNLEHINSVTCFIGFTSSVYYVNGKRKGYLIYNHNQLDESGKPTTFSADKLSNVLPQIRQWVINNIDRY